MSKKKYDIEDMEETAWVVCEPIAEYSRVSAKRVRQLYLFEDEKSQVNENDIRNVAPFPGCSTRHYRKYATPPMLSNRYQYSCLMHLASVLLYPLLGVLFVCTCLSNMFHNLGKSTLGSLAYGNTNILEAIQSRIQRLRLQGHLVYVALRQIILRVFAGHSLFNPPHTIFVIKEKLTLTDTRIIDVARMLKTTMLRVEVPPMCGNDATAYTHPALVFNVGMCNQKFAEFNRCNPIHRK